MEEAELEGLRRCKRALEREVEELKKKVSHDVETKVKLEHSDSTSSLHAAPQKPLDLKKLIDDLTSERATLSDAASRLDGSCCELKETNTVLEGEKRDLENTLKDLSAQLQESSTTPKKAPLLLRSNKSQNGRASKANPSESNNAPASSSTPRPPPSKPTSRATVAKKAPYQPSASATPPTKPPTTPQAAPLGSTKPRSSPSPSQTT